MDTRTRFMLLLVAFITCTNAAVQAPRLPWPVVLLAFVVWLVASSLAVFTRRRRRDV